MNGHAHRNHDGDGRLPDHGNQQIESADLGLKVRPGVAGTRGWGDGGRLVGFFGLLLWHRAILFRICSFGNRQRPRDASVLLLLGEKFLVF